MFRNVRKQITYPDTALTILLKFPRRLQNLTNAIELSGQYFQNLIRRFPMIFSQQGFRIKGIHLGRRTIHVKKNNIFSFGLMMQTTRRVEFIFVIFPRMQNTKSKSPKPIGTTNEHLSSRKSPRLKISTMHNFIP